MPFAYAHCVPNLFKLIISRSALLTRTQFHVRLAKWDAQQQCKTSFGFRRVDL